MIWGIYKKELKDSFRDRRTLMLSIFLPVLLISGMSLLYENLFFRENAPAAAKVGVAQTIDEATWQWLSTMPDVELTRVADPQGAALEGEVQIALELTPDFASRLESGAAADVKIYADQSSMNVSRSVDLLKEQLADKERTLVDARLAASGVDPKQIQPFAVDVRQLQGGGEMSTMMISMLFSLIITLSVMLGGMPSATDLFAGEKERKTMEALLITPVSRLRLIAAKWLTISTLGTVSGIFSILAFVVVTKLLTERMAAVLDYEEGAAALLFSAVLGIVLFSALFAALQMIISIVAKSYKEAQSYMSPIMFVGMIPYFLLIGLAPNELTPAHFLIPFMNIFALLKELIYGIFSISSLLMVLGSSLLLIGLGFAAAYAMFKKDKWVLGQ
ncbi:sodium transport system permease protein [Paenibacillus sp. UNCCL117]|uniref:ABC transporter permease n=1 Tax=unclassified Paenibacillus TaxID=185978 RepID=UPI000880C31D|nr:MULTISPECIES: ABC transporter permease [unclassified Paenibacillus]SDD76709.1 sodium transport system permease protein [Paenibacillus sp. cl123]SFW52526.1 sodium transport system permease protein [Paenibacillus sp. UNCCL117]